jgi:hypothetical protein
MNVSYGAGFFPKVVGPDALIVVNGDQVSFNVPDRRPAVIRKQIERLKDYLLTIGEKAEMPIDHTLIDGVYTRTLFIPKGTILVGKIHLKECINIVAKGDISILTETGLGRVQAGYVARSGPGTQKVGYAHEDTVFVNVFRTDETDIEKIEAEISTEKAVEHWELICQ